MTAKSSGSEVLDILFDDSLLEEISQVEAHGKLSEIDDLPWPSIEDSHQTLDDLDHYSDDVLTFLNTSDLNQLNTPTLNHTSIFTTSDACVPHPISSEHDYSKPTPAASECGSGSEAVPSPLSDNHETLSPSILSGVSNNCGDELFTLGEDDTFLDVIGSDFLSGFGEESEMAIDIGASLSPPSRNTSPLEDQKFNSFTHGFEKKSKKTPNTLLPFHVQDVDPNITAQSTKFPELRLSDEEKELLAKEGIELPQDMPLTKEEERALKSVRRKIRNKISAKESRKRKMEYVDGIEKRVKIENMRNVQLQRKNQTLERRNQTLEQRNQMLEKENLSLKSTVKTLQMLLATGSNKTAQTSTCVMVLLLSFALLVIPNVDPFGANSSNDDVKLSSKETHFAGNSRVLMQQDVEKPQLLMVENIDVAAHYASSPSLQDDNTAKNKRHVRSQTDDISAPPTTFSEYSPPGSNEYSFATPKTPASEEGHTDQRELDSPNLSASTDERNVTTEAAQNEDFTKMTSQARQAAEENGDTPKQKVETSVKKTKRAQNIANRDL